MRLDATGRPRVRYWVFNYMPQWEAVSKEIETLRTGLAETIDGSLVGLNTIERSLRLRGEEQRIPLPYGVPLLPLLVARNRRGGINHLFASAGERWLTPRLAGPSGVLTIAKDTSSFARIERNAGALRRYGAIVVQAERDRDFMRQLGVHDGTIRLIRPGIPPAVYRPGSGPFTILFASSPLSAGDFFTRGIHLLLQAAARLPDVRFLLAWRRHHVEKLRRLIAEAQARNVEVLDGRIDDMGAVYDRVHATILPALEHRSFVPAPRSALESLAHGKPVLASHFVAIAGSIASAGAGVAFEPTLEGLEHAVTRLRTEYSALQARTQPYVREHYSPSVHLELHRRLYRELGRGSGPAPVT